MTSCIHKQLIGRDLPSNNVRWRVQNHISERPRVKGVDADEPNGCTQCNVVVVAISLRLYLSGRHISGRHHVNRTVPRGHVIQRQGAQTSQHDITGVCRRRSHVTTCGKLQSPSQIRRRTCCRCATDLVLGGQRDRGRRPNVLNNIVFGIIDRPGICRDGYRPGICDERSNFNVAHVGVQDDRICCLNQRCLNATRSRHQHDTVAISATGFHIGRSNLSARRYANGAIGRVKRHKSDGVEFTYGNGPGTSHIHVQIIDCCIQLYRAGRIDRQVVRCDVAPRNAGD